jgi:hypothetical protein
MSTLAGVVGGLGLWLHWLRWRHDQLTKSLIVRVTKGAADPRSVPWQSFTVSIRSRANSGYKVGNVRVIWPPSGRITPSHVCWDEYDAAAGTYLFKAPENPKRHALASIEVSHAGQANQIHASGGFRSKIGDSHSQEFLITRKRPGVVLIGIDVIPEDETIKPFTRIKRIRYS